MQIILLLFLGSINDKIMLKHFVIEDYPFKIADMPLIPSIYRTRRLSWLYEMSEVRLFMISLPLTPWNQIDAAFERRFIGIASYNPRIFQSLRYQFSFIRIIVFGSVTQISSLSLFSIHDFFVDRTQWYDEQSSRKRRVANHVL